MCSRNIYVLYTYLIRENGINFLSQREESGSREREGGREGGKAEKKSGVESVVFVYSTRQKFFSLKDKFQFYYDIIDDYSFPNIFSELL